MAQPVIADCPVKSLNVGVLLGITRLNVIQADPFSPGPVCHHVTDILRTVIATQTTWCTSPFDDLLQGSVLPPIVIDERFNQTKCDMLQANPFPSTEKVQ